MEKADRVHIISEQDGSSVPFLRGILTRSLQKVELSFEDAYNAASEIRELLAGKGDITGAVLRQNVASYLAANGYDEYVDPYLRQVSELPLIRVHTKDGSDTPFSKGLLVDSLEICGLPRDEIYAVATAIESELLSSETSDISSSDLIDKIVLHLKQEFNPTVAADFKRWVDFSDSGRPLIVLVGGSTGTGKSSIGSELAHRLDIVRTQSTDMLREVMRLLVPDRLLPTLHTSSFDAHLSLPATESNDMVKSMIAGYLTQSEQVAVGVGGVLNRSANEQVSLIIEGVHLHPELMHRISEETDAVVVPIVLAILKRKRLKKRLIGRGQAISSRRSERYLNSFEKIWNLQSFLLSEADRYNITIVPNDVEEETIQLIMQTVSEHLRREF